MNVLVSFIYVVSIYNGLYRPLVRKRGDYIMLELLKKKHFFYFHNLCKDLLFPSLSLL